ncbi:MAG: DNA translocase FtsK, partial [Muribaculaceae bacterium]|nr:DNA translocase FtsK [Muribaculaceae bacterium]
YMENYYNYSPEIPTGDDNPESNVAEQQPKPEPEVRKRRRRPNDTAISPAEEGGNTMSRKKEQAEVRREAAKEKQPAESAWKKFNDWLHSTVTRSVMGIMLGGLGLWFGVAFFSYLGTCIEDQSLVESASGEALSAVGNDAGEGGAVLTELLFNQGFGVGSFVLVVWLILLSMRLLIGKPKFRILDFTIKSLIAFITLSVVVGMLSIGLDTDVNWGGFHGRYINEIIYRYIGWSGAIIISVVLVAIFVMICLRDVLKWILKKKKAYDEKRRILREEEEKREREEREIEENEISDPVVGEKDTESDAGRNVVPAVEKVEFDPDADTIFDLPELEDEDDPESMSGIFQDDPDSLAISEEPMDYNKYVAVPTENETSIPEGKEVAVSDYVDESEKSVYESISESYVKTDDTPGNNGEDFSSDSEKESVSNIEEKLDKEPEEENDQHEKSDKDVESADDQVMTVNVNQIEKGSADSGASYDTGLFTHEYKFPPSDYLIPGSDKISVDADEQLENKEKIRKTLLDFGIPITSIEATVGPTVTLYEIRPDTGVKIAKIRNLVDDLALSLAARGVRIIAPIPGKGTVGIEVANKDAQTVSMRTIIQSKVYQNSKFKLPVALGSTISNDVYIADLAKMPHLLVAGATGQGKSVGLNAIITSLLYSKRPEELKFVMVDPKRVEFSLYSKIENYYLAKIPDSPQPIITNMENVVATLSSLCVEMDERYKLLEKAFVRQVSEYNEKFREKKLNPKEGHRFMPYIVVIIDEFADLIMTAGKEVELPIARLAQLARAVGIHVIIATQRPSTNVITGMIKANFPVRIAFKVSSGVDSKTILDSTGAQQLIGRGDMLISNNGEMIRVQCAFVDTPEVEEICDYIARQPYPQGPYILPEPQVGGESETQELDPSTMGKRDPLLEEVARQVVMSGTASTSAVQRRYEIGYNRAGRIMDQLEALGVVGPATGGKPRTVLMDPMSLEDLLSTLV